MLSVKYDDEIIIIDVSKVNNIKMIRELSYLPLIIFSARKLEFYLPLTYELELKTLLSSIEKEYNMATQYE